MSDNIIEFNKLHKKSIKKTHKNKTQKNKNQKHSIFLIFLCLALGFSLFCAYREMYKSPADATSSGYDAATKTIILGKTVDYDLDIEAPVKDDIWVMYQNLSSADKRVYDMFLDLVEHRRKISCSSFNLRRTSLFRVHY